MPERVVHLWGLTPEALPTADAFEGALDAGFYSLLFLAQALGEVEAPLELVAVTAGVHDEIGTERLRPEAALALGACRVIPQDLPLLRCRSVDVEAPGAGDWSVDAVDLLVNEAAGDSADLTVAYRQAGAGSRRYRTWRLQEPEGAGAAARGAYLVTGGLGGRPRARRAPRAP
jgi:hypothetical protein